MQLGWEPGDLKEEPREAGVAVSLAVAPYHPASQQISSKPKDTIPFHAFFCSPEVIMVIS